MLRLVYRQLTADLARTLLTCVGIGGVIGVILVLEGFEQGIYAQLRQVVLDRGGDLIATQAGVANMTAARSVIPQMSRNDVEEVQGVTVAHPMTGLPVIYERNGRRTPIFLFVYDTGGGPLRIIDGEHASGERGIVIDRSLAQLYGIGPGDDLVISDYRFEIRGVTDEAAALFTPFAYIEYDTLIDFYFEADLADDISAFPLMSYLVISVDPGSSRDDVAARIEDRVAEVDVFSPEEIGERDVDIGRAIVGAILRVLIVVAYVTGVLVVGLFMFAATSARRRDLGVLKALGFSVSSLLSSIVIEAGLLTTCAIPVGIGFAYAMSALVAEVAPVYLILPTETAPLLRTIAAAFVFALIGALVPLRFVRDLAPAEVFSS